MPLLPQATALGVLKIVEVFAEHDFPIVFAAKNVSEQILVAIWTNESAETTAWLYAPVSPARLGRLRDQKLSLREVFTSADGREIYRVTVPKKQGKAAVVSVRPEQLVEAELPPAGAMVQESEIVGDEVAVAFAGREEDAEISIDGDPVQDHAIRAGFFGKFLRSIQDFTNALGQTADELYNQSAERSRDLIELYRLLILPQFEPSSFKLHMKLAASEGDRLAPEAHPPILDIVSQVLIGDAKLTAHGELLQHPLVRAREKQLLKLIAGHGASVTLRTRGNPHGVKLTAQRARDRVEKSGKSEKKDLSLNGILEGGSVGKRQRFELKVGETTYIGRTSAEAKRDLHGIALGSRVSAVVTVRTRIDKTTGEPKTTYTLKTVAIAS